MQRHALGGLPDWDSQDLVSTVFVDRTNTVWAGTIWGLFQRRARRGEFGHVEHIPGRGDAIPPGIVLSISSEPDGTMWIGTLGSGLVRLAGHEGMRFDEGLEDPDRRLEGNWVWDVHCTEDATWIATHGAVHRYDLRTGHLERLDLPQLRVANDITGDTVEPAYCVSTRPGDPSVWLGGRAVLRRHPDGRVERGFGPDSSFVQALLVEADGLWIGTTEGLWRADIDGHRSEHHRHVKHDTTTISHDAILCLHRDTAGRLWIGTQSGLNRFDETTGRFHHLGEAAGLPSSAVYGILEDDEGRLWISTNRGLARLDVRDPRRPRVRTFGRAEGVRNLEFNRRAYHRDATGQMYFGGDRGLTYFRPESVHDVAVAPVATIAAATITGRDGTRRESLLGRPSLRLGPNDNAVTFELVASDYNDPAQNRFGTKLDGFDRFWRDLGSRDAAYTNVPPGTYTLRARTATSDGPWGEDATLRVVVTPPFPPHRVVSRRGGGGGRVARGWHRVRRAAIALPPGAARAGGRRGTSARARRRTRTHLS